MRRVARPAGRPRGRAAAATGTLAIASARMRKRCAPPAGLPTVLDAPPPTLPPAPSCRRIKGDAVAHGKMLGVDALAHPGFVGRAALDGEILAADDAAGGLRRLQNRDEIGRRKVLQDAIRIALRAAGRRRRFRGRSRGRARFRYVRGRSAGRWRAAARPPLPRPAPRPVCAAPRVRRSRAARAPRRQWAAIAASGAERGSRRATRRSALRRLEESGSRCAMRWSAARAVASPSSAMANASRSRRL